MGGAMSRASIATASRSNTPAQPIPEVGFHVCDVLDVPRTVARDFDIIYMLNAFYAFDRQGDALAGLRKVAKPGAQLVIFDYTVGEKSQGAVNPALMPHAIRLSEFAAMLREAGWEPGAVEDLNAEYVRWYAAFVERIRHKQAEIEKDNLRKLASRRL